MSTTPETVKLPGYQPGEHLMRLLQGIWVAETALRAIGPEPQRAGEFVEQSITERGWTAATQTAIDDLALVEFAKEVLTVKFAHQEYREPLDRTKANLQQHWTDLRQLTTDYDNRLAVVSVLESAESTPITRNKDTRMLPVGEAVVDMLLHRASSSLDNRPGDVLQFYIPAKGRIDGRKIGYYLVDALDEHGEPNVTITIDETKV